MTKREIIYNCLTACRSCNSFSIGAVETDEESEEIMVKIRQIEKEMEEELEKLKRGKNDKQRKN